MQPSDFAFGKAVKVIWEDSAQIGGWREGPVEPDAGRIESVGRVCGTNEAGLAITTSINDQGSVMSPLSIPWSCIMEIEEMYSAEILNAALSLPKIPQSPGAIGLVRAGVTPKTEA